MINPSTGLEDWEVKRELYSRVVDEQFFLNYVGKISYEASNAMPITERRIVYNLVNKVKQLEKEAIDSAKSSSKISRK